MTKDLTIPEAAKFMQVSPQAVYVAIKSKKMGAYQENGRWLIPIKEIHGYMGRKYSRTYSTCKNGKPKFDKNKGELCTREVAERLNISMQRAYYLIRCGALKSFRKGSSYVILIRDLEEAKKILNNNLQSQVQIKSYDFTESDGQSGSLGSA